MDLTLTVSGKKCVKCNRLERLSENDLCDRCTAVIERRDHVSDEFKARRFLSLAGSKYQDADKDDLEPSIRKAFGELKSDEDVFMHGPVGTGKTYAMAALIRHYLNEGYECERINFDDFCIEVRSTMSPAAKKTEWQLIEPLKAVDKLFIDDLGLRSKQESDFAYVTLYSILNKRQERGLPTYISTNRSLKDIAEKFDARIGSRLTEARVILVAGQDRRANKPVTVTGQSM
ncbi:hypothetical protein LCGC14_2927360 [marine sediment metagenome]|uniref:Chromosomal replication initiator protein DnaA ATPAse domain-containing protein n=1 Tax=marine sediment metagenome TaxID=412755 RepID=A0A0F9AD03_9ZZZZ